MQREHGYWLLSRYRGELMGLALLWVMLFHAYYLKFDVLLLDGFRALGYAGVDIFILLSGMGLYVSLSKTERVRLTAYYARRAGRILPAYWLVVGLYSLWLWGRGRISLGTGLWSLSTLHYWFHIPDTFNWYVPALLAFYLISPFYIRLLRRCRRPALLTALAFPVSYGLYRLSIPLGLNYMEDFLYRLPVFAEGCLIGRYLTEAQQADWRDAAGWGALALCGAALALGRARQVLYVSLCYIFAALAVPFCVLLALMLDRLPWRPLHRLLARIGESSFEIYLLNVIVTREFDVLSPLLDRGLRHVLYYLVVYLANLLLGMCLHRMLQALAGRGGGAPPPDRTAPKEEAYAADH